ncbi:hypothetical protein [Francisella sp. SYW-9]|uniref:hypothetical protein n=1 Tax=Francisella sp. SYW-9 TaxID=2610888 RepID=UPI00123E122A|nr:hypothetical protein [Francisella sp. SYW-9]
MRIFYLFILLGLYYLSAYSYSIYSYKSDAELATGNVIIKAKKAVIYKNNQGMLTAVFPKNDRSIEFSANKVTNLY